MVQINELLELMAANGGKIVCTASLDEWQIQQAIASNRMYVDHNNYGYVWIPKINEIPVTKEEKEIVDKWYPLDVEVPSKIIFKERYKYNYIYIKSMSELIELNEKFFKEHELIMLPRKEKPDNISWFLAKCIKDTIGLCRIDDIAILKNSNISLSSEYWQPQDLYFISTDKPRIGDYSVNMKSIYDHKELCRIDDETELHRYVYDNLNDCRKVVASTNHSLKPFGYDLPIISNDFVEYFVSINRAKSKFLLEYEKVPYPTSDIKQPFRLKTTGKCVIIQNLEPKFTFIEKLNEYMLNTPINKIIDDFSTSEEFNNIIPIIEEFLDKRRNL